MKELEFWWAKHRMRASHRNRIINHRLEFTLFLIFYKSGLSNHTALSRVGNGKGPPYSARSEEIKFSFGNPVKSKEELGQKNFIFRVPALVCSLIEKRRLTQQKSYTPVGRG